MDTKGRIGYEVYAFYTGITSADGKKLPTWDKLPPGIQKAWDTAAAAIIKSEFGEVVDAEVDEL